MSLNTTDRAAARQMIAFLNASPTPYHAVATAKQRLAAAGFIGLTEGSTWKLEAGKAYYVVRAHGSIVAFRLGRKAPAETGFRIIGAHTDSPNLRVKPSADDPAKGYRRVGVEVYGGVLLSTWLDRDLSVAGLVHCSASGGHQKTTWKSSDPLHTRLVDLQKPLARVPNLAIHLNRNVNQEGLQLNAQKHMVPLFGQLVVGGQNAVSHDFLGLVAQSEGIELSELAGFDLCLYDTQAATLGGAEEDFIFSGRLDNLASCWAALEALCRETHCQDTTHVVALFDHEECGSRSVSGAAGSFLRDVLQRVAMTVHESDGATVAALEQNRARAMAQSFLISSDMAHGVHPSYADKHEANHEPQVNRGMVIKLNTNQNYATSGATAARFSRLCAEAGSEAQNFVVRSDMPCGGTIGPMTAAAMGIAAVDVGAPMLSMHSAREMAGSDDAATMLNVFTTFFRS